MNIGKVGKIVISEDLKNQIDYYHKKIIGKEWSGVLFFKHIGGSFDTLTNLEFLATNIFLMDIGTGTFTNFENDGDIAKAYDCIGDENLESLTGFCHSHHNMQAFFSSTDLQELKDNASIYNFYISLVVNVAEEYVCKIVFPSETTSSYEYVIRDLNGTLKKVNKNFINKEFIEADLEVVMPITVVPKWVEDRITEVEAKKKAKLPQIPQTFSNNHFDSYRTYGKQKSIFESEDYYPQYSKYKYEDKPYLTSDEKFDKFLKSILYLEAGAEGTISDAIAEINKISDEEWMFYLEALTLNIEIMYDHVYGDAKYPTFDTIFNRFISFLQKQPNTERMKELIETLSTEWEVR